MAIQGRPLLNPEQDSLDLFWSIVNEVKDYAVFILDTAGRVTTWNAGAESIKGYSASEIIGSPLSRFYRPEDIALGVPENQLRTAASAGRYETEGWRLRKDGATFWASVVLTALHHEDGRLRGFLKITRDVTERRQREEAVRRSEERFRLLVEGMTDCAIFMLDAKGLIDSWNVGVERTLGYGAGETLGKHFSILYRREDIEAGAPSQHLAAARQLGGFECEGWRLRKDGPTFWAKAIITPLFDPQARPHGYAHVIQDLTQQRHAETLEDISRQMNEFIAMLSHELRNPLAPIRNAVSVMQRKGLGNPVLESMCAIIGRQTDTLTRIVDELLDANRVARGQLTLDKTILDLQQIVARAVETSRPLIERHEHTLHVATPDRAVTVHADALRLTQMTVNLLNNSARYTPPGGHIWLSLEVTGAEAELRVRDTGSGIDPDVLPRVFDLFFQGHGGTEPGDRGLGVGLALVRRIVELHGGRIDCNSEGRGRGTEFVVSLPALPAVPESVCGLSPTAESVATSLPRHRIAVADDNVDAATSLGLLLESLGQEVRVAYNGASAIGTVERFRPQIVMLDLGMPILDGYEVASRLRASPQGSQLILVAVTGWGQESDTQRVRAAGFDHHLVKPVSEAALKAVLLKIAS